MNRRGGTVDVACGCCHGRGIIGGIDDFWRKPSTSCCDLPGLSQGAENVLMADVGDHCVPRVVDHDVTL
jgi:hypothetical protein